MLKQIEENYKYIMIMLLVVYLINFAYLGELTITVTIIGIAIVTELAKQRKNIKKLTFSQLAIIGIVLLTSIAVTIYMLVLFRIFLEPLNIPAAFESIILMGFIIFCLYVIGYFLKKIYVRAIGK